MPMGEGVFLEQGCQRGVPPLKRHYFVAIGFCSVKTVPDRYRLAASTGDGLFRLSTSMYDFEPPKEGFC